MRKFVTDRNLQDQIQVDSAGTIDYHTGHAADERMQTAAAKRGYELNSRARQITEDDCQSFDLVVAMDRENLNYLQNLSPENLNKMKLLGEFLEVGDEAHGSQPDVPDPYYGGESGFEEVMDMIEAACPQIIDQVLAN